MSLEDQLKLLTERLQAVENDRFRLDDDVKRLRDTVQFQNSKLDRVSTIVTDLLKNENNNLLSLSSIQDTVNDVNVDVPVVSDVNGESGHNGHGNLHHQHPSLQRQGSHHTPQQGQHHQVLQQGQHHSHPHTHISSGSVPPDSLPQMDGNIHPQLQVGSSMQAVNGLSGEGVEGDMDMGYKKRRKALPAPSAETKRPKISIDFIHNPMTVQEIYDEFYKGFKGQPPLCDLDQKFGKLHWRGDSRSKESKRFQRRKRLCDAITRGMQKYNKSADDIIAYIEKFRGDKSLTWVMNGNLPQDLLM